MRSEIDPWVVDGDRWAEYEDQLIGNVEGLARLRDHIDTAIQTGSAQVVEPGLEWSSVRVVERNPQHRDMSWLGDKLRLLATACFYLLGFASLVSGVKGLWEAGASLKGWLGHIMSIGQ